MAPERVPRLTTTVMGMREPLAVFFFMLLEEDDMDDYDERPRSNWWKVLILIVLIGGTGYFGVTRLYESIMASFTITEALEYPGPRRR